MKKILTLCALMAFANAGYAEYRWVADTLYVPLRSGKGNQFRILDKGLKTGTRLTLVSEDQEGGWAQVITAKNVEGWIRSQYLLNTPTASEHLKASEIKLAKLQQQYSDLKQQLGSAKSNGGQISNQLIAAEKNFAKLQARFDELTRVSTDAIDLYTRHQKLMLDHQLIRTEQDVLKAENERLRDDSRQTFFLYGAGTVGFGVLITLIVPRLRRRKSFSEWG